MDLTKEFGNSRDGELQHEWMKLACETSVVVVHNLRISTKMGVSSYLVKDSITYRLCTPYV
jgi:hypothetical protein